MNKNTNYHIWNSDEDLMANVNSEVKLPDGGKLHTKIGKVAIKKGDAVCLDYGRSMGVYTMSGRGYESEFKHGKISLHGCPAYLVLEQTQSQNIKYCETTTEEFNAKIENQKNRIAPEIESLKDIFIFEEMKRRSEAKSRKEESDKKTKEKIKTALSQINEALGKNNNSNSLPKPKKP